MIMRLLFRSRLIGTGLVGGLSPILVFGLLLAFVVLHNTLVCLSHGVLALRLALLLFPLKHQSVVTDHLADELFDLSLRLFLKLRHRILHDHRARTSIPSSRYVPDVGIETCRG